MTDTDESASGNASSTGRKPRFNSETARAAGKRSAEVRKAKAEERRLAASSVVAGPLQDGQTGVLVPVDHVNVIQALNRASVGGDVQAAGTLLRWLQQFPHVDTDVALDQQPRHIRNRILRKLIREAEEEATAEQEASLDPDGDTDTAAPTASPGPEATPQSEGVPARLSAGGLPEHTQTGNPGTVT